jgi:hypothetical protein
MKKQKGKKVPVKKARARKAPAKVVQATKTHAVISHDDGKLGLSEGLIAQHRVGLKGKPGGAPVTEVRSRDEIDWDSGRVTRVEEFYDRRNDHTKKVVTYQDTGEVKLKKSGRLSEKNKPK